MAKLKSTAHGGRYHTSVITKSKAEAQAVAAGARAAGSRARITHSKGHMGQHPHYTVLIGG